MTMRCFAEGAGTVRRCETAPGERGSPPDGMPPPLPAHQTKPPLRATVTLFLGRVSSGTSKDRSHRARRGLYP